jgi:hypothetical protein
MRWADELVESGFAWMVFLGSAVLWKERTHFRVDLIPKSVAGAPAEGLGKKDMSSMIELLEKTAGVRVRGKEE